MDAHLRNWLLDTNSLTERLQAHCRQFAVDVIGQAHCTLSTDEQALLFGNQVNLEEGFQVREVILKGDHSPWVFARSLLPQALMNHDMRRLLQLGDQPLGKVIFNDARFVRQPFELLKIEPHHPFLAAIGITSGMPLWGRRSLFQFEGYHLVVAEVFLPLCPAYKQLEQTHE